MQVPLSLQRARHILSGEQGQSRSFSLTSSAAASVAILVFATLANRYLADKAERDNPPKGRFIEANGVNLHWVERGEGPTVVLLHGNGSMVEDFESSGLIDLISKNHRVIAFDRPGLGHSDRPRDVIWTPDAQAAAIAAALGKLGVLNAVVLGHSWGASVAIAMALNHTDLVRGLVLASGYYYPTFRPEVAAMALSSLPIVGDIISHTVAPLLSRAMWPIMLSKVFGPRPVPEKFSHFPKEMALRPSQISASAAEASLLVSNAYAQAPRYNEIKMPVAIVAGAEDRLIATDTQSGRLHRDIPQSTYVRIAGNGHMIQQTATNEVARLINDLSNAVDAKLAGRPKND